MINQALIKNSGNFYRGFGMVAETTWVAMVIGWFATLFSPLYWRQLQLVHPGLTAVTASQDYHSTVKVIIVD